MWDALDRLADRLFGRAASADEPRDAWVVRYLALAGLLALTVMVRRPDSVGLGLAVRDLSEHAEKVRTF